MMEYRNRIYDIPIDQIEVDYDWNSRDFQQMDCADLRAAILKQGQQEAGKVVHQPDAEKPYFLVAGFRRMFVISQLLKQTTYRAIVMPPCDDIHRQMYNFTENHARKDLTIYDQAMIMKRFFDAGFNEKQIQEETGVTRGYVQPRVMLLKMMNEIPELVEIAKSGELKANVIRDLYSLKTVEDRRRQVETFKTKVKFKLKLSVNKNDFETKKDMGTMLMERKKPQRQKLLEWALGAGVPFADWPVIIAWSNGVKNDEELLDQFEKMIEDPCCYPEFRDLVEGAESYVESPETFLAKVLEFKEGLSSKGLERPKNGIPLDS